jgi:hypothetical protein
MDLSGRDREISYWISADLRVSVRQWPRRALAVGPVNRWIKEEHHVQVFVRDNNVNQALKAEAA